ncbi:hypothetical protein UFOVP814_36 [uncultured Caudovirales phage]|uniref:Uncharacterized protein n=1 Tax=uncultured Caudovirales phage TaxID=2100421 RepID=A0A6J5NWY6_9CAUD|nr:hypothetical protein UFOVP814_36 [uncultured Caudovirales phage]
MKRTNKTGNPQTHKRHKCGFVCGEKPYHKPTTLYKSVVFVGFGKWVCKNLQVKHNEVRISFLTIERW